ncbi:hypothetical protein [Amycolatopsis sp. NPDC004378]
MTTLATVAHIAQHARNRHLSDRLAFFCVTEVQTVLVLPDDALDLFVDWARSLENPEMTGVAPGPIGTLEVTGRILSGDPVQITVHTDGDALRAAGLVGALVLGQVEQHARKRTAVPA